MDQMSACQREEEGDFGVVSLFEHLIAVMCCGCHRVSVHSYIQPRGCTRRWVSVLPLKCAHFPAGFVGGRALQTVGLGPWPYTAQAALRLGTEPIAATSAHIPHCYLFHWGRRCSQLGFQCTKVLSEAVLCVSPAPSHHTARSCSPICWLTSGENSQNQTETQHSVWPAHRVGTDSTDHCGTNSTSLEPGG